MSRNSYSISIELRNFREAKQSLTLRDSIALISMMLLEDEQREVFKDQDGVVTVVDHLTRLWKEQRGITNGLSSSSSLGIKISSDDVEDLLTFLLISVIHMTLDDDLSIQAGDLNIIDTLGELLNTSNDRIYLLTLEAFRNLLYAEENRDAVNSDTIESLWKVVNSTSNSEEKTLALDILCNLASSVPKEIRATQDRLSKLVGLFLKADTIRVKHSIADLLCNLARDVDYSVLLICEMDERKPLSYSHHSGVVYLLEVAEKMTDEGLKSAVHALSHNLAWSGIDNKRKVEKIAASSFLSQYNGVEN